jgi:hypothetical protein
MEGCLQIYVWNKHSLAISSGTFGKTVTKRSLVLKFISSDKRRKGVKGEKPEEKEEKP